MNPQPTLSFFAPCPRGVEALLVEELKRIGGGNIANVTMAPGGAAFTLMRLAHVPYKTEREIYAATFAIDWPSLFAVTQSIRVDVNAIRCPLRSLDFVTLRIKDAVCDLFRTKLDKRPDVDTREPDVRIHGFLDATHFTLYLDTSGEPLYKRGWRSDVGEAPLKENLAAAMILLSGWDGRDPFYDPMCGSGTLLIEAALIALGIPPGFARQFGFEKLAGHDAAGWAGVRQSVLDHAQAPHPLDIYGSDLSPREVERTRENLEAAGLLGAVVVAPGDILEVPSPAASGVMVTNPPYGVRLGDTSELAEFYPKLGNALKARFAGWRCYFLSADPDFVKLIRLSASKRTPLFNGPLECRLYEYKMQEGSARKRPPQPQV